jgi:hypothetical protein
MLLDRPLRTTAAAEGMARRAFTVAELEAMTEAGILLGDERIELIGGDVVPMSPKGDQHEIVKVALSHYWARSRCAIDLPADERLTPTLMPSLAVTLAELDLG